MQCLLARCLRPGTYSALRNLASSSKAIAELKPRQQHTEARHRRHPRQITLLLPLTGQDGVPAAVVSEADGCIPAALVVLAGLGFSFLAYGLPSVFFGSKRDARAGNAQDLHLELLNPEDFKELRRSGSSVTFTYVGSDPHWQGCSLRLRLDDHNALVVDRAATRLFSEGFNLDGGLIAVSADFASTLLRGPGSSQHTSLGERVTALKLAGSVPAEARKGAIVTVELRPGTGIVALYGSPSAYSSQEDSGMQRDALARAGKYSARDIFSGRPDRVRRALHALEASPQDALRVLHNGNCILPAPATVTALDKKAQTDIGVFLEVAADCFDRDGKALLTALLQAQCSSGATTNEQARQLDQIYHHHIDPLTDAPVTSQEALQASFARGFWTLSADDSGKTSRERDGERLLERARRELWVDGSASRCELEKQVRTFLCRNLLGRAANSSCLQVSIVEPRPGSTEVLRNLRFSPSSARTRSGAELWYRIDLLDFEVPLERVLKN